jgi:hypothetical protein
VVARMASIKDYKFLLNSLAQMLVTVSR